MSVEEIIEMVPAVPPEGLVGAAFSSTDGCLDQNTLVPTIAADAVIANSTTVTGFDTGNQRT